jgi:hypothetical protein
MSDTTIYEIEVTYITKLGNMKTIMSYSDKVEGREQLDEVIDFLKTKGFEKNSDKRRYSWSVYHANNATAVKKTFAEKLAEFKPADDLVMV